MSLRVKMMKSLKEVTNADIQRKIRMLENALRYAKQDKQTEAMINRLKAQLKTQH